MPPPKEARGEWGNTKPHTPPWPGDKRRGAKPKKTGQKNRKKSFLSNGGSSLGVEKKSDAEPGHDGTRSLSHEGKLT